MRRERVVVSAAIALVTLAFGIVVTPVIHYGLSLMPWPTTTETAEAASNQATVATAALSAPETPPADNAPEIVFGPSSELEFDPTGSYYPESEKMPKALSDIDHIFVETAEYTDETARPVPPSGYLQGKKAFKFTRIAVGPKQISFQTVTVGGVSYRFVGHFLTEGYCEFDGDLPDLKGRLIKIKDGRWSAEAEVEFFLECGC